MNQAVCQTVNKPLPERDKIGLWKKGFSGNPGGRLHNPLREYILEKTKNGQEMADTMLRLMRRDKLPRVQIEATTWLRDTSIGKPIQMPDISVGMKIALVMMPSKDLGDAGRVIDGDAQLMATSSDGAEIMLPQAEKADLLYSGLNYSTASAMGISDNAEDDDKPQSAIALRDDTEKQAQKERLQTIKKSPTHMSFEPDSISAGFLPTKVVSNQL